MSEQPGFDGGARFHPAVTAAEAERVNRIRPLHGATVLEVGADESPVWSAFGATCRAVRPSSLGDAPADVAVAVNVLEHLARPWAFADDLVARTRSGGLIVLAYPVWYSLAGGHETSPWHYLGGYVAADRYGRRTGTLPRSRYGIDLFPLSVAAGLRWAATAAGVELLDVRRRFGPAARGLLRLPGLREVLTGHLWLLLRRR